MTGLVDRLLRVRNRFPRVVNRAIDYVADHPMGLLGQLAARRLGYPLDIPEVSTVDSRLIRVFIAPVNYSNQGRMWARSLELADPRIAARNMAVDIPGGFSFPADLVVPVPVYHNSTGWQSAQLAAVERFSHVLIEAEEPLFGRLFGRDVVAESRVLIAAGVDVAFIAHGTDVRLPSRHAASTPWSPYLDPDMYLARLERRAQEHIDFLTGSGRPVFVSTPDLLADLPNASWCPVVIDPSKWAGPPPASQSPQPLRVVHAPSSPTIKGTQLIEPTLRRLMDQGTIEYVPVVGVASSRMPEIFREADVVLDQFRLGSYGVAACEAMAAGKTVIGHVLEDVRDYVSQATGLSLPVVEATPASLEGVLKKMAADRSLLGASGRAGITFVSAVHDGRRSAAVLKADWLDLHSM